MKYKTVKLLLPIVCLGFFVAILVAFARSAKSSSDKLPLNEVWTFQADGRILATPILIDHQIIFRTADKIYSVNAINGGANWEITARASDITINVNLIGKPIVGNSKFLVSEEQNNSIGIYSTKTGEKIWTVEGQVNFINALEVVDDSMIVARHDGNLIVYDLTSYQNLWEVALPARSPTPLAANTELVILGAKNDLRIYDLKDGRLLNTKTYDASSIWDIALSESNVFVNYAKEGGDESISSLRLDSLDENWVFHAGEYTAPNLSLAGDHLSLFNKALILLDSNTGNVVWRDDSQKYYSEPAFHGNNLFFISVQRMFDNNKEMCKVEIREDTIKDCSLVDSTGRLVTAQSYLLGPLATNDVLIVPQDSTIAAFTIP
jgi:outer membrane protein assembly factor BamB